MQTRGIVIDRSSAVPLYLQLQNALRDAILSGKLKSGERLLSSRHFRLHLGLSRNTVVDALGQLEAEGYLVTVRGVGTFVAETVHGHVRSRPIAETAGDIVPSAAAKRFLSVCELAADLGPSVPFRPGTPALDLFPATLFKRGVSAQDWTCRLLDYPDGSGNEQLREAIVERLTQTRGIVCSPGEVLITNGAQSAFALISRVILGYNDRILVEDPGYPSARAVFLANGARIVPIRVDDEGIVVSAFAKRRATCALVTPSHQYPTGAVLSLTRRFALLDWASTHDAWIIEDDYDSEFNYTGRPQPALQSLDGRRVIYVGTFSKVLAPALRIGYVVLPKALSTEFKAAAQTTGEQPSPLLQRALANFMQSGHFSRHITKMRAVYNERRRSTSSAFRAALGDIATVRDSGAGLHFTATLENTTSDRDFSARAAHAGIVVPALSSYFYGSATLNGLVIGYAATAGAAAKAAIETLREVATESLPLTNATRPGRA